MTTQRSKRGLLCRVTILALEAVILFSIVVFVISALVIGHRHWFASTGPYRKEYMGRIVEKTVWPYETLEGSFVKKCLIIEEKDGVQSLINVEEDTFARAQPGQWIRRTPKGIQLFSTDPTAPTP